MERGRPARKSRGNGKAEGFAGETPALHLKPDAGPEHSD
jgi:hypothetical protein